MPQIKSAKLTAKFQASRHEKARPIRRRAFLCAIVSCAYLSRRPTYLFHRKFAQMYCKLASTNAVFRAVYTPNLITPTAVPMPRPVGCSNTKTPISIRSTAIVLRVLNAPSSLRRCRVCMADMAKSMPGRHLLGIAEIGTSKIQFSGTPIRMTLKTQLSYGYALWTSL
jgi:hypothetical protein